MKPERRALAHPLPPPHPRVRRRLETGLLFSGVTLLLCVGMARADSDRPTLFLHAAPLSSQQPCNSTGLGMCETARTGARLSNGSGGPFYFVYLLAARGPGSGVGRLRVGVDYDGAANSGVDVFGWNLCAASQEYGSPNPQFWPNPQGVLTVTFDSANCSTRETVVAGYFYCGAYSPDALRLIPNPTGTSAYLADCALVQTPLTSNDLGQVNFSADGTQAGFNPCAGSGPPPLPPPPPPPDRVGPPVILVHLTAAGGRDACASGGVVRCEDAVVSGSIAVPNVGPFYYAYLIGDLGNYQPSAGIQCGITYEKNAPGDILNGTGIDIFGWTLCATLEFATSSPHWPEPGSGNLITWSNGQCRATPRVAGFFYLGAYGTDRLQVVAHPLVGDARMADCDGIETVVASGQLGWAGFAPGGQSPGCNPCAGSCDNPTPVRVTTWGGIKAAFGKS